MPYESQSHNPYEDADPIRVRKARKRPAHATVQEDAVAPAPQDQAETAPSPGAQRHVEPLRQAPARPMPAPRRPLEQHPSSTGLFGQARPYRTRRKTNFGILVALILGAIAILSALLWWINRPVPVTVDGAEAQVRVGSNLADVFHEQRVSVEAGDYVSVSGNVLKAGAGDRFSVTVDGQELSSSQADEFRVGGGETIEFSDGRDIIEEYTAVPEEIMPQLRFEGGGYALQYVAQWGYPGIAETRHGTESGETAVVRVKEPVDCVVMRTDPYLKDDDKIVALTFDDGPNSPYTESYLDICRQYGVKATFFNLGVQVQEFPELARRIVDEGHTLANHTMDHNQLSAVDGPTIYRQINASADVIEDSVGVRPTFLRPPYGDFTDQSWLASGGAVCAAICWTADSRDWSLPGSAAIVDNCLLDLHSGSIILMHDGGGDRSQDVEALPLLIEALQAEGYRFVSIGELLQAAGAPADICTGSATMPQDAVWPTELALEEGLPTTAEL